MLQLTLSGSFSPSFISTVTEAKFRISDVFQVVHHEFAWPILEVFGFTDRVLVFVDLAIHVMRPALADAERRPEIVEHMLVDRRASAAGSTMCQTRSLSVSETRMDPTLGRFLGWLQTRGWNVRRMAGHSSFQNLESSGD